jgi:hypothetical protein
MCHKTSPPNVIWLDGQCFEIVKYEVLPPEATVNVRTRLLRRIWRRLFSPRDKESADDVVDG